MTTTLDGILENAGFALLHDRALLRISGPDATRWLNGMVTNSAQALEPGVGNYNFLLNAQGRIQGDCLLYREPDSGADPAFLLATDAKQMETIQAHLDRFIIMDDVELTPVYAGESTLQLLGPEAPNLLQELGLPALDPLRLVKTTMAQGDALLLSAASQLPPSFEIHADDSALSSMANLLRSRGVSEVASEALEALRILAGTPQIGPDIRDRELPQETNQAHALHFAKGCYLGQEIVERIRSRGQVHRSFTPLVLHGSVPEVLPAPLEAGGKAMGEITSATTILRSGTQHLLGLGYVRREALETGAPLTYAGGTAEPRRPGQVT